MNDEVNKCQIQVKTNYIEIQSSLLNTFIWKELFYLLQSEKKWMP
jgi:hypothetical protein